MEYIVPKNLIKKVKKFPQGVGYEDFTILFKELLNKYRIPFSDPEDINGYKVATVKFDSDLNKLLVLTDPIEHIYTPYSIATGGSGSIGNISKEDLGLDKVDNTSDSEKQVLSASKLTTPRSINGVPFDGTLDITITDSTKEPSFIKNTAFNKNFGTQAGQVAEGNHTHKFSDITNKPNTLGDYGITDAQNTLISGTNIKTVNSQSLLGSGDIEINSLPSQASKNGKFLKTDGSVASWESISYSELTDKPNIPTKTSDLTNDSNFLTSHQDITGKEDKSNKAINLSSPNDTKYPTTKAVSDAISAISIPTVNNGILTIQKNGSVIDTFTANSASNKTINVTVPTKTSDIANDSGFVTTDTTYNSGAAISIDGSNNINIKVDGVTIIVNASDELEVVGGGGGGSVTSVGLTAPTGFSVSNSPITTGGNIVLTFAAGYSLPTTTKQGEWDNAYIHSQVTTNNPHNVLFSQLSDRPTKLTDFSNDLVNDKLITIQKNGITVDTFTLNQSSNKSINIVVPTKTSDLSNDSGYLVSHQDISGKEDKSNKVTSFSSPTDTQYPSAKLVKDSLDTKANTSAIPTKVSDLTNDSGYLTSHQDISGKENISNKKTNLSDNSDTYYPTQKAVKTAIDTKQNSLVSGTNIKTINGSSILGSGDISTSEIPNQVGNSGKFLTTDGSSVSWGTPAGGGGGTMDSFAVSGDTGTNQTISDGDTLSFIGGTGINTVAGASDKITISLDSATQTSLGKANSALQSISGLNISLLTNDAGYLTSHQDITGKEDKSNKITTWGTPTDTQYPSAKLTKDTLDTKQATITGAATTITSSNLTTNRAVVSDGSGKIAISAVNSTELGYLSGVSSSVQTQLNGKQDSLGFTPENSTNKATNLTSPDNTKYPTTKAVSDAIAAISIPVVNDAILTIQKNGVAIDTFTANSATNKTVNIIVPTKTSDITNDSGFLTSHQDIAGKEDKSNKVTSFSSPTDTQYPSAKLVNDQLAAKQVTITGAATTITSSNLTTNRALVSDGSGKVTVSSVTSTELGYLSGVSSAIQTQLNGKISLTALSATTPLSYNNGTGAFSISKADGSTNGYLSSTDWTTFNNKQATINGAATTITSSNLTNDRALISNGSGKVDVSTVTSTELGYISGVTSSIQTQLNSKQNTLVSGTNIKTINGTSILGSGNLTVDGLPAQAGKNGKYLKTDGANASWEDAAGGSDEVYVGSSIPTGDEIVWIDPTGAADTLSSYTDALGSDVQMPTSNTWYDATSIALPIGTFLINAQFTAMRNATTALTYFARLTNKTTHYASSQAYQTSASGNCVNIFLTAIVTLASATTIYLQGAASSGAATVLIKAALSANESGNNATQMTAIKL